MKFDKVAQKTHRERNYVLPIFLFFFSHSVFQLPLGTILIATNQSLRVRLHGVSIRFSLAFIGTIFTVSSRCEFFRLTGKQFYCIFSFQINHRDKKCVYPNGKEGVSCEYVCARFYFCHHILIEMGVAKWDHYRNLRHAWHSERIVSHKHSVE